MTRFSSYGTMSLYLFLGMLSSLVAVVKSAPALIFGMASNSCRMSPLISRVSSCTACVVGARGRHERKERECGRWNSVKNEWKGGRDQKKFRKDGR